jgi:hypothetical protein
MATEDYKLYAIGVAFLVLILTLFVRKKILGDEKGNYWSEIRRIVEHISTAALIRYKPTSRYERAVQEVVRLCLKNDQRVLLVSSAPRTEGYAELFREEFSKGNLMLVKISANPRTDSFYLTGREAKKEELKGKIAEISVDWLEYLTEVIEGLSKGSNVVFEPLSDLILMNGFEKTFKFIKKTIDYCIGENIHVFSFINDDAHEDNVKASFEGLFTNIAVVTDDKIEIIK